MKSKTSKRHRWGRLVSLVLCIGMLVGVLPAFAEEQTFGTTIVVKGTGIPAGSPEKLKIIAKKDTEKLEFDLPKVGNEYKTTISTPWDPMTGENLFSSTGGIIIYGDVTGEHLKIAGLNQIDRVSRTLNYTFNKGKSSNVPMASVYNDNPVFTDGYDIFPIFFTNYKITPDKLLIAYVHYTPIEGLTPTKQVEDIIIYGQYGPGKNGVIKTYWYVPAPYGYEAGLQTFLDFPAYKKIVYKTSNFDPETNEIKPVNALTGEAITRYANMTTALDGSQFMFMTPEGPKYPDSFNSENEPQGANGTSQPTATYPANASQTGKENAIKAALHYPDGAVQPTKVTVVTDPLPNTAGQTEKVKILLEYPDGSKRFRDVTVTVTPAQNPPEPEPDPADPAGPPTTPPAAPKHTVTFHVEHGTWQNGQTEDITEQVAENTTPTLPEGMQPADGYTGGAWNKAVEPVTGDVTYTYTFEPKPKHTVTFEVRNGTFANGQTEKTEQVTDGNTPTLPTDMQPNAGFEGGTWDKTVSPATGNTTYVYTFAPKPKYTVTYEVENGKWSDNTTAPKTEQVTKDDAPADVPTNIQPLPGYGNGHWEEVPTGTAITGAKTFKYVFTPLPVQKPIITVDKPNSKATVTLADESATKIQVSYKDEEGNPVSLESTKGENGNWTLTKTVPGVTIDPATGAITIPAEQIEDNTPISAQAENVIGTQSPQDNEVITNPKTFFNVEKVTYPEDQTDKDKLVKEAIEVSAKGAGVTLQKVQIVKVDNDTTNDAPGKKGEYTATVNVTYEKNGETATIQMKVPVSVTWANWPSAPSGITPSEPEQPSKPAEPKPEAPKPVDPTPSTPSEPNKPETPEQPSTPAEPPVDEPLKTESVRYENITPNKEEFVKNMLSSSNPNVKIENIQIITVDDKASKTAPNQVGIYNMDVKVTYLEDGVQKESILRVPVQVYAQKTPVRPNRVPHTGDSAQVILYAILFVVALSVLVMLTRKKKKN